MSAGGIRSAEGHRSITHTGSLPNPVLAQRDQARRERTDALWKHSPRPLTPGEVVFRVLDPPGLRFITKIDYVEFAISGQPVKQGKIHEIKFSEAAGGYGEYITSDAEEIAFLRGQGPNPNNLLTPPQRGVVEWEPFYRAKMAEQGTAEAAKLKDPVYAAAFMAEAQRLGIEVVRSVADAARAAVGKKSEKDEK